MLDKYVWFIYLDGRKRGPVSSAQLKQLALEGKITPETVIENEAGQQAKAGEVQGLFFEVGKAPEVPSPDAKTPASTRLPSAPMPPPQAPLPKAPPSQTLPSPPMPQENNTEVLVDAGGDPNEVLIDMKGNGAYLKVTRKEVTITRWRGVFRRTPEHKIMPIADIEKMYYYYGDWVGGFIQFVPTGTPDEQTTCWHSATHVYTFPFNVLHVKDVKENRALLQRLVNAPLVDITPKPVEQKREPLREPDVLFAIYGGFNQTLKVKKDRVIISKIGQRTIPISSIQAVQHKKAYEPALGLLPNLGHLQFVVIGSSKIVTSSGGGIIHSEDENMIEFYPDQNETALKIKEYIEECIIQRQQPQTAPAQTSAADEILKFKQLLDAGVISQEEFDAKKKQLLGL